MSSPLKRELQDLLSGTGQDRSRSTIEAAARHLSHCAKSSTALEGSKHFKREEEKRLIEFVTANGLWLEEIDFSNYVSEGAEQKVYLEGQDVLKLNDAIYYRSWKDYLFNLLLHNYFFVDTAYELLGFTRHDGILLAVVKQQFVRTDEQTELDNVKAFLMTNGFLNTRNNDYFHPELGIILED